LGSQPDQLQQLANAILQLGPFRRAVDNQWLRDDVEHGHARIQ
jgi:hypothetical protein